MPAGHRTRRSALALALAVGAGSATLPAAATAAVRVPGELVSVLANRHGEVVALVADPRGRLSARTLTARGRLGRAVRLPVTGSRHPLGPETAAGLTDSGAIAVAGLVTEDVRPPDDFRAGDQEGCCVRARLVVRRPGRAPAEYLLSPPAGNVFRVPRLVTGGEDVFAAWNYIPDRGTRETLQLARSAGGGRPTVEQVADDDRLADLDVLAGAPLLTVVPTSGASTPVRQLVADGRPVQPGPIVDTGGRLLPVSQVAVARSGRQAAALEDRLDLGVTVGRLGAPFAPGRSVGGRVSGVRAADATLAVSPAGAALLGVRLREDRPGAAVALLEPAGRFVRRRPGGPTDASDAPAFAFGPGGRITAALSTRSGARHFRVEVGGLDRASGRIRRTRVLADEARRHRDCALLSFTPAGPRTAVAAWSCSTRRGPSAPVTDHLQRVRL